MLDNLFQKDISLNLTSETEAGSGVDQPSRENPSAWNEPSGENRPQFKTSISGVITFENSLSR